MANVESYQVTRTLTVISGGAVGADLLVGHDGNLAGANAQPLGVNRFAVSASGEAMTVQAGVVKVTASAAISAGALIYSSGSGKVATATIGTNHVIGVALEAASADGDVIKAFLF